MASGELIIDEKLVRSIYEMEKALKGVTKEADATQRKTIEWLSSLNSGNIDAFTKKIKQLESNYMNFANALSNVKGFENVSKKASDAAESITRVITAMGQNTTVKSDGFDTIRKTLDSLLAQLAKARQDIDLYYQAIGTGKKEYVEFGQTGLKEAEARAETLMRKIEALNNTYQRLKQSSFNIKDLTEGTMTDKRSQIELEGIKERLIREGQLNKERLEQEAKAEKDRYQNWLAQKHAEAKEHKRVEEEKVKATQDAIRRQNEIFERNERRMRAISGARADTSKGALNYANRIFDGGGIKSVENMQRAIHRMREAQNRLNLGTEEGRKKYTELANKIKECERELNRATNASSIFNRANRNLLNTGDQLARKLSLVFSVSQVQGYMSKIVAVRKEFELQQKALSAIIGDQDKANELWNQTVALAVKSPFRVKELVTYTKQLAAYRIETDKLHDTTKRLADVSAGLGVDMDRLILAYGQVRAANFLRGTELRQFTEAGIPMLDELAKHFTDVEGRAVSAGEAFERISKRMVTFKDVAKVFENLTNEGGTFFKMQEKQSETLHGMISNLHDSLDLMMNDIGKANDGVLKGLVSIAKSLADNWRAVSTVLKEVAAAMALMKLAQFYRGIQMVRAKHVALAASMNGAAGAAGKMTLAFRKLGTVIKANPIWMIVGVLAAAGYAMWEYWDAIKETNKKYDEMSEREIRRIQKLEDLQSAVEKNNAVLKDAMSTEEKRNKAIDDNKKKLEQLKKEYPQLTNEIKVQENGVIQLTDAIKKQNDVWRMNIILQQQAKGGFGQEDALTNYNEALEERAEAEKKLYDARAIAITKLAELENAYFNNEVKVEDYIRIRDILTQISKAKDLTQYNKAFERYNANKDLGFLYEIIGQKVYLEFEEYEDAVGDVFDNVDNMMSTFRVRLHEIKQETKGSESPDEQVSRQFGTFVDEALKNIGYADEELRKRVRDYVSEKLQVKLEIAEPDEKNESLENWAENVKAAVTALNEKIKKELPDLKDTYLLPVPTKNDTKESYLNIAKARLEDINEVYREGQQMIDEADVKAFDSLKPFADEFERILNISEKASSSGKGKDWFTEMAKSIRDTHKEFVTLHKDLDKTAALEEAIKKNEDAFLEAANQAGLNLTLRDFVDLDSEGGAIGALLDFLNYIPESAKDARLNVNKFIGDLTSEDVVNKAEENAERLRDTVENMFGQYEFSIELEKLNIPKDVAKRLFDVDAISLDELRKKLEEKKPQFVGTDQLKEYNKFLKKIDKLEKDALQERLKRYSKFIIDGQSERARLKIEELHELAKLEDDFNNNRIQKPDYELAKSGIKKETKKKLDEVEWDAFKESGMYIQLFEDLGMVSGKVLDDMLNQLEQLKGKLDSLDPTQLKEILKRMEEIRMEKLSRNPFDGFIESIKKAIPTLKALKKQQQEYNEEVKKLQGIQTGIDNAQINIASAEEKLKGKNLTDEQKWALNEEIKANKEVLELLAQQRQEQEGIVREKKTALDLTWKEAKELGKQTQMVAAMGSQAINAVTGVTDMLKNWGVAVPEELEKALGGIGQVFSSLESIDITKPFSIITGSIGVLTGIGNFFASIFGGGDAAKEKQIKKEMEYVEKLEKAYEKLEKAIDEAYSIDTLKMSYDNAEQNLKEQIAANNRMIELERQKKDTDDERIKEWQEENEKLQEKLEEHEKQVVSKVTDGILDDVLSAADEFTNAWLEAFNETGDGMKGLEDSYGEMMKNMVKRQAAMLITSKFLEQWKNQLDKYINKDDLVLTADEAKNWAGEVQATLPQLNEALKSYFESMKEAGIDIGEGGEGELSGLQKGIQGVTEETALAIEGYLNSIRFFVSEKYRILSDFVTSFSNPEVENPIVSQLKIIAKQTSNIYTLLDSLTAPHPTQTGLGLKVVM